MPSSSQRSAIAGVHEVLEVGERLALGHRAPVPLREHLVRQVGAPSPGRARAPASRSSSMRSA